MKINPELYSIRAKKIGLLISDARVAAGKTLKECADYLEVSLNSMRLYERGEKSPSLPELELLAYYFHVPLEHFWGQDFASESPAEKSPDLLQVLSIRNNMINVIIRQQVEKLNMSMRHLAQETGLPISRVKKYVAGQDSIPVSDLEGLCKVLDLEIEDFYDHQGPIGSWRQQQKAVEKFMQLPPDIQDFVTRPVNLPYIQVAIRLNEMSVEKLRTVAEGLLEITL